MSRPEEPRILVTGAGGPAAIGVMRAIASTGVQIHAADIDPFAQGLYGVPADQRLLIPRGDAPDFATAVHAECRSREIDLLFPTVESELLPLVNIESELAADGITLISCSRSALEICLDKWATITALEPSPLLARTELLDSVFDSSAWEFPVFSKPRRGSGSTGAMVVPDPAALAQLPHDGTLLVQELLPGKEFSVDVLALPELPARGVVRERLKIDSGIAVTSRIVRSETLEAAAAELVVRLGIGPIANVQFRGAADGSPRLLEINPRVPGTIALTIAGGINMPELAVQAALGLPLEAPGSVAPVAMVRALEDKIISVAELAALADSVGDQRKAIA